MSKNKDKKIKKTSIGGQAVIEGVMMRGRASMATAVRDGEGGIQIESSRLTPPDKKPLFLRLPVVRGVVSFISSLVGGTKTLMRSAAVFGEEDEPSRFEKWLAEKLRVDLFGVVGTTAMLLGVALSVFLFVMLPQWATGGLEALLCFGKTGFLYNLIEGLIRIAIFVCYILLTSLMPDIKRTYMYHGAEHKTITCYEKGLDLTVENAKGCRRVHDRCGTTFLFFVMLVSILVFSVANSILQVEGLLRMLLKIALLPVVAGLSYELLRGLSKTDSPVFYPLKAPGLLLQRITTREPTDDMLEVAITAFNTVLKMDEDESVLPQAFITAIREDKLCEEVKKILFRGGITDESDAEWIVSIASGVKRSDVRNGKDIVQPSSVKRALELAEQRASGRPLWYVVGDADFYGYTLKVDERVLIPRPETEELVAFALETIKNTDRVLDLCTGSGAIAVVVNLKSGAECVASDISEDALSVARENAKSCGASVRFVQSDMLDSVEGVFDCIISNPPYISSADIDKLDRVVRDFEPRTALDGGADGLDFYRRLAKSAPLSLKEGGRLYLECGVGQAQKIVSLLAENGFCDVTVKKDLSGIERMIYARKG